jgi:ATP-binding cassette subfamily B multidrug efflux pump
MSDYFNLSLAPAFSRRKRELLATPRVPAVELPPAIEKCLASIELPYEGEPESRTISGLRLWLEAARPVRPLLFRAAGLSLISACCASTSALVATRILKINGGFWPMAGFACIYFIMNGLSQVAILNSGRLRGWVGLAVETRLAGLISRKLLRMSSLSFARQSQGNLKTLITSDAKNIGQFLDNLVRNFIPAIMALIVVAPLLIHFTGMAGVIGIGVMASILPLALGLNRISSHYQEKSQEQMDSLTSLVGEWVKNIRLIRYLSWDEAFSKDVALRVRGFLSFSVVQHFMTCLIFGLSISWWMVSITGVLIASHWMHQPLALVDFFGSLWLLSFLAGHFTHLPNTIRLYGQATPSVRRIARLLSEDEQADSFRRESTTPPTGNPVKLVFDRVSFRYDKDLSVIQELSTEFEVGEKLAIVGEIGSGKSTLLKLLCGELPPTSGSIQVVFSDGSSHNLWTQSAYHAWRSMLGFVPQEPFVSSDLLGHNITLLGGLEAADSDDHPVLESAYWAELEADLAQLPQGIRQEIGESGVNLSGGQRQRLNLARARFSGRSYLVLDDTMSALDTRTETALMKKFESRSEGFVLVTHRTGELMRVQKVMVMKDGTIIEQGSPESLASRPDSHLNRVLQAYEQAEVAHE